MRVKWAPCQLPFPHLRHVTQIALQRDCDITNQDSSYANVKGTVEGPERTPCALQVRVHGDAHDAGAREARELWVLKLLAQGPGYKVAAGQLPLREAGHCCGTADGALQCHLDDRKHVRQRVLRIAMISELKEPRRVALAACCKALCQSAAPVGTAFRSLRSIVWNMHNGRHDGAAFTMPKTFSPSTQASEPILGLRPDG